MEKEFWIARDRNGMLGLYDECPKKNIQEEVWMDSPTCDWVMINNNWLPDGCNPQWEDEEPIKVKLIKAE